MYIYNIKSWWTRYQHLFLLSQIHVLYKYRGWLQCRSVRMTRMF